MNGHSFRARFGAVAGRTLLAATLLAGAGIPAFATQSVSAVSCTPGYKPCIPNKPSDVDCYGGSGNGPRYTKPGVVYKVKKGYDRYGLDANQNGWGCE